MTMDLDLLAEYSSKPSPWQSTNRRLLKKRARALLARTTCIHPQLRDLLVCSSQAGQVTGHSHYTLSNYKFGKHGSTNSGRREHFQSLSFIPNVLISGCGLLAAGGPTAELALRSIDPTNSWCIQTHVGRSINNSVHISPSPFHPLSRPRLHISNNDHSIYLYELHYPKRWGSSDIQSEWQEGALDPATNASGQPELEYVDRIVLETPINHTSVSPDGRSMIAVGDTNQVFVFDINAHGQHTLIDTLEASEDASFSTSWSRTGDSFAVASQDGYVTVFDRRYRTPLKQFRSHQRGSNGAARVVKYSQGPHELLAFSEQKNYIHIIDARTYEYSERVHLPSVELDGHIKVDAGSTVQATLREYMRHSFIAGNRNATARNLNPWDTYPEESVLPALDWRDCPPQDLVLPFTPASTSLNSINAQAATPGRSQSSGWDIFPEMLARGSNARSSPSAYSESGHPVLPRNIENSTPNNTVSTVLANALDDSTSSSSRSHVSAAMTAGLASITGMDWDPSGKYLYASMEKIILEWEVDSASRRCHPHATLL